MADVANKEAKNPEDGDGSADKSSTSSEYILCKPCYEKEQYPKEDVAEAEIGKA